MPIPRQEAITLSSTPGPSAVRRAMVSLVVIGVMFAASHVSLPWKGSHLQATTTPNAAHSILALGMAPFLTAFLLVELAALMVPAWRPLRRGSPSGRRSLDAIAVLLGLLLTSGQACVQAIALEQSRWTDSPGLLFRFGIVLVLVGSAAAMVVAARWVNAEGLGGGFAILLLGMTLPWVLPYLGSMIGALREGPGARAGLLDLWTIVLLPVVVVLWICSQQWLRIGSTEDHPSRLSRPACGVLAITLAPAFLKLCIATSRYLAISKNVEIPTWVPAVVALLAILGCAHLAAYFFNLQENVHLAWRRFFAPEVAKPPSFSPSWVDALLFTAVVGGVEIWRGVSYLNLVLDAATTLGVVVILIDLWKEFVARQEHPDLIPVWEIYQPYAIAPTLLFLEREGILSHASMRHTRSLFQFFAPYIPVVILVPAADAVRAREMIQSRWKVAQ